jgi:hypothetical protein
MEVTNSDPPTPLRGVVKRLSRSKAKQAVLREEQAQLCRPTAKAMNKRAWMQLYELVSQLTELRHFSREQEGALLELCVQQDPRVIGLYQEHAEENRQLFINGCKHILCPHAGTHEPSAAAQWHAATAQRLPRKPEAHLTHPGMMEAFISEPPAPETHRTRPFQHDSAEDAVSAISTTEILPEGSSSGPLQMLNPAQKLRELNDDLPSVCGKRVWCGVLRSCYCIRQYAPDSIFGPSLLMLLKILI